MAKEEIQVPCTYCETVLKVVAADVDRIVKCTNPSCRRFVKIPGKVQQRMELECPVCNTLWNLPLKLRGKIYSCWKCHTQTQLLDPARIKIEDISFLDQVEQGVEDNEIIITVSNPGTPAILTATQLAFENNGQDVSSYYEVIPSQDNVTQVDYTEPIELRCNVAIAQDAPVGVTTLYIQIAGHDALDEKDLTTQVRLQWAVIPQRIFHITTEHDGNEIVAAPFAIQLCACLITGEIDPTYEGIHHIQFESTATESEYNIPPIIPNLLKIEFHEGVGITGNDFVLYNALEITRIMAWEDVLGGPEGESEEITVKAGELEGFELRLADSQVNFSSFTGDNKVQAVDRYGNIVTHFAQDIWIYPGSNSGEIFVPNGEPNIIPGSAFRNGVADLSQIGLLYSVGEEDKLPKRESFIVSYEEKEGCSKEVMIEPSPLSLEILGGEIPEQVEQGQNANLVLVVQNNSRGDLDLSVQNFEHQFVSESTSSTQFYELHCQNLGVVCEHKGESRVEFGVKISDTAPTGITQLEIKLFFQDSGNQYFGKQVARFQWQVEPKGRIFKLLAPTPKTMIAGKKFGVELGAYFQGELNSDYQGLRTLVCSTDATASSSGAVPEIPEQIQLEFHDGIAKSSEIFLFVNAEENPTLLFSDPAPGGAQSESLSFSVEPADLDSFMLAIRQESLVNGETFGDLNQAIARDIFGNLKTDFSQDCEIFPESGKGRIFIGGEENNIIPADAFAGGIADLAELAIAFHAETSEKLPFEEKFCLRCGDKEGKSRAISINPSPAKIKIARCSNPEEIDLGEAEFPIYLELENIGDKTATISSVLLSFTQGGDDVSSNYTITASPTNTNELIPGVPLQLTYTVKASQKTPLGTTEVEVKISGLQVDNKSPLQAVANFQWTVEGGTRIFRVFTLNNNREYAGAFFSLKIESLLNDEKDSRFNGEKTIKFSTTATSSPNGQEASIPETLTLHFNNGEVLTQPQFTFTNAGELPIIKVTDSKGKVEGMTEQIQISPGSLASFQFKLKNSYREGQTWTGNNAVIAMDEFGNVIKDFDDAVNIAIQDGDVLLVDENEEELEVLLGEWFREGTVHLSEYKLTAKCAPEQQLPAEVSLVVSYADVEAVSAPFEITARPVTASLLGIQIPESVVQGQGCQMQINVQNGGASSLFFKSGIFIVSDGNENYELKFTQEDNGQIPTGKNDIVVRLEIPEDISCGPISGQAKMELFDARDVLAVALEGEFQCRVEPQGRLFSIETQNEQHESAGIPFALQIKTLLNEEQDNTYEGTKTLCFKSNAKSSDNGQNARIAKTMKVDFEQGMATTEPNFTCYKAEEGVVIEVMEEIEGGAHGETPSITIAPGPVQKFQWKLHGTQYNAVPFEGENILRAFDAQGNAKKDFREDLRIYTKSQKGDIQVADATIMNTIPGHHFENGVVNLTELKFRYTIGQSDYLPLNEHFIVSYGDKNSESPAVEILPRPLNFVIKDVVLDEKIYQSDTDKPFSITIINSGDATTEITKIDFAFLREDIDITPDFTLTEQEKTHIIAPEEEITLEYKYTVAPDAETGMAQMQISVHGRLTEGSAQEAEVKGVIDFELMEQLREFEVLTENDNSEIAGEAFKVKLIASKDGIPDKGYEGERKIHFSIDIEGDDSVRNPSFPKSETIKFVEGVGQSSQRFIVKNTKQKIFIHAEEPGKAYGRSVEVEILPGALYSLKIVFDGQEDGPAYRLHMLDNCENVMDKNYKLDENLKAGVVLSGTGGMFYEIQEIVGHGAMGKVYKGRRLNDNLRIAIKTMLFSALSDISRFLLEAHMLIRFNHDNIVKGYDIRQLCTKESNKVESKFFMVMEFLTGNSVKELIDVSPDGLLHHIQSTEIILKTARALAYMWERQTIHRDIKPDNIQFTNEERVKLIDLGIARAEGGMVDITLTQKDTVVGSYPYISPERLKDTGVDYRSDVYSLGVTYYHMVTGMPPYLDTYKGGGGRDLLEYLIRVRTKKMPTPPHKLQEMPMSVSNAIMAMLRIKANKRCDDPQQLLSMLEDVFKDVSK